MSKFENELQKLMKAATPNEKLSFSVHPFKSSEINKSNHRKSKKRRARIHNISKGDRYPPKCKNLLPRSENAIGNYAHTFSTLPKIVPQLSQPSLRVIYTPTCRSLQSSHKSRTLRKILHPPKYKILIYNLEKKKKLLCFKRHS